jgi:opacity protein-like surface antigen
MKASLRILISAIAVGLSPSAFAADYEPPIVVDQPVEEVPVEVGSGWYLRGDIGYNFDLQARGDFDFRDFNPITGVYSPDVFDTASLGEQVTWGAGFGYNFTDMIRADFTVDGFRANFDGTTSSGSPCAGAAAFIGTACRSQDSSDAAALSFMVNGYVDLGTYVGFTPYVGGGLGYTYIDWGTLSGSNFCVDGAVACPAGSPLVANTENDGEESWRFTYAAMAGIAYDVSQNLKIDLGYRYRRIEGGPMFAFDAGSAGAGASGTAGDDPGFSSHEVRVGLRYELW